MNNQPGSRIHIVWAYRIWEVVFLISAAVWFGPIRSTDINCVFQSFVSGCGWFYFSRQDRFPRLYFLRKKTLLSDFDGVFCVLLPMIFFLYVGRKWKYKLSLWCLFQWGFWGGGLVLTKMRQEDISGGK